MKGFPHFGKRLVYEREKQNKATHDSFKLWVLFLIQTCFHCQRARQSQSEANTKMGGGRGGTGGWDINMFYSVELLKNMNFLLLFVTFLYCLMICSSTARIEGEKNNCSHLFSMTKSHVWLR